jgi:hypothetical protein
MAHQLLSATLAGLIDLLPVDVSGVSLLASNG